MNKTKKPFFNAGGIIAVAIVVCILATIVIHSKRMDAIDKRMNLSIEWVGDFDSTDSMLFKAKAMDSLEFKVKTSSDTRHDLVDFRYGKDLRLFYTTIVLDRDITLDEAILFLNRKTRRGPFFNSASIVSRLDIGETQPGVVDSIVCSYTGSADMLEMTVYSDSFKSYYMPIVTFSIQYGIDEPVDMTLHSNISKWPPARRAPVPTSFAFLKKERTIYFIVLTAPDTFSSEEHAKYREMMRGLLGDIIDWEEL